MYIANVDSSPVVYCLLAPTCIIRNHLRPARLRFQVDRWIIVLIGRIHKHIRRRVDGCQLLGGVGAPDAKDALGHLFDLLFGQTN